MSERRVSLGVMSALGMERLMHIRNRSIGPSSPPYVIAEVSCNHAGSEAVAMALIDVAKQSGADAVKFQFYTPEGMVGDKKRTIEGGPWEGLWMSTLYEMSQMPWQWGPRLKARCHELDLAFIASAYDVEGLDWLMQNCKPDALKVASFEATDTPFVEVVAKQGLPVIVSVGMMGFSEACDVYRTLRNAPNGDTEDFILLHCVSAYPTKSLEAGLWTLEPNGILRGFSDHTIGHSVACAAIAKGACVLEKHIQLSPFLRTADSHFSATPDEFSLYCKNVREAWEACQPVVGDPEKDSRQFRRAPGGKRGSYVA